MSLKVKVCLFLALSYLVDANSSSVGKDSSDSRSNSTSNDGDAKFCKKIGGKLSDIHAKCKGNNILPTCTCGEIRKVRTYNEDTNKYTAFQFCSGCTGFEALVDSPSSCSNFNEMFSYRFIDLCQRLYSRCKETITFFACECPTTTTTTTSDPTTPGYEGSGYVGYMRL